MKKTFVTLVAVTAALVVVNCINRRMSESNIPYYGES